MSSNWHNPYNNYQQPYPSYQPSQQYQQYLQNALGYPAQAQQQIQQRPQIQTIDALVINSIDEIKAIPLPNGYTPLMGVNSNYTKIFVKKMGNDGNPEYKELNLFEENKEKEKEHECKCSNEFIGKTEFDELSTAFNELKGKVDGFMADNANVKGGAKSKSSTDAS